MVSRVSSGMNMAGRYASRPLIEMARILVMESTFFWYRWVLQRGQENFLPGTASVIFSNRSHPGQAMLVMAEFIGGLRRKECSDNVSQSIIALWE